MAKKQAVQAVSGNEMVIGNVDIVTREEFNHLWSVLETCQSDLANLKADVMNLQRAPAKQAESAPETDDEFAPFDHDWCAQHDTKDWFNPVIKKGPPKAKCAPMEGLRMGDLDEKQLKEFISFQKWKVKKDKEKGDAAPKNDKGEFWYKGEIFKAKLAAVWLERLTNAAPF